MTDAVKLAVDGTVAWIELNRPEKLNAIDDMLAAGLRRVAYAVEVDPDIRAVVIRGSGGHFMAGGDIGVFRDRIDDIHRTVVDITHDFHAAIVALRRMPKPVIASVEGAAAGAGLSLAMACDMIIAADNAFFTLAYSQIGASPDGSSTFFLPRIVGMKKAMELTYLAERFDTEEAKRLGIVNFVVPAADLAAETEKLARRLADGPTAAYGRAKALLNASLNNTLETQLDAEAQGIAACSQTEDFREGTTAFLAKRKPNFKGR